MSVSEIWEVAAPLIIAAAAMLVVGLFLLVVVRRMKPGLFKKITKVFTIIILAIPLLFLTYALVRAIIFVFFL